MKRFLTDTNRVGRVGSWRRIAWSVAALVVWAASGSAAAVPEGATLVGIVTVKGPIPPPQLIVVNRDPAFCGATITMQEVTVSTPSRGLWQAVVSVSGLQKPVTVPRQTVNLIKNRKCAFAPHVSTMQAGDVIGIGSDDPVLHNTHIRNDKRTFLNVAMVPGGRIVQKPVRQPGVLTLRCDAHKFMRGYALAFDHPYFATTDEAGRFRITGLPAGVGRITVWHETLGTLQQEVTIPAKGEVSVSFVYSLPSSP